MPAEKKTSVGQEKQPLKPPTRLERIRYNQYVKKTMLGGGTPATMQAWLATQRK